MGTSDRNAFMGVAIRGVRMQDPSRSPAAIAVLLLAATLAMSGCIGGSSSGEAVEPTATGANGASLVVVVTDPAVRPVPDARVTVDGSNASATTGPDGTAAFQGLAAGAYTVHVAADGFHQAQRDVRVPSDGVARLDVTLAPIAVSTSRVQHHEFEGFFECTATALIVTGDCFAVVRAVAPEPAASVFNVTNAEFTFDFPVPDDWTRIEVTQTWSEGAATTGDGMRVNLEPAEGLEEGHATRYAVVSGTSPLHMTVERGVQHPSADDGATVPLDGGMLRTRTFHNGVGHNGSEPPFLGAGLAFEQRFTVVVSVYAGGSSGP